TLPPRMASTGNTVTSVYGIRHHGPGSARSVRAALAAQRPDVVLIEGPPEADDLVALAADPDMRPPVALLGYVPGEPRPAGAAPDGQGGLRADRGGLRRVARAGPAADALGGRRRPAAARPAEGEGHPDLGAVDLRAAVLRLGLRGGHPLARLV